VVGLFVGAVSGRAEGVALGAKVGTLGTGVEVTKWVWDCVNVRVGGNYLPVSFDWKQNNIDYTADLTLASVVGLVDWHVFNNNFRVSGGALYNRNRVGLNATPTESKIIGDGAYSPQEIGTLEGDIKFKPLAPYLGIGFGDAVEGSKRLSFSFDLGLMFQGAPDVDLSANGTMADNPIFLNDLEKEKTDWQDEANRFRFYPVLSFGMAYHF